MKRPYTSPTLATYGDVERLTGFHDEYGGWDGGGWSGGWGGWGGW